MTDSKLSIKEWAEDDRPREKLLTKGTASLSNAELLAIILGSGSREESAVDLCKRILNMADNNLQELGKFGVAELTKIKGIGEAKAISIIATLELGRRRALQDAVQRQHIQSSKDAFQIFHPLLGELPHEEFWCLYLNNSNRILFRDCIGKGGLTGTVTDVRIILRKAIELLATNIILCHNHPSGNMQPSDADKNITSKIVAAASFVDIRVVDHIIVTASSYFSFADEGLIS